MKINQTELNLGPLVYNNTPTCIILHHAEASNCSVQDINSWHKNQGWAGIGYQYLVRKDGSIWRGRPENAQGAHCQGYNTKSIGICAEGKYQSETMPEAQRAAIAELIKNIQQRHGKLPIYGHRDLNSTDCPGKNYPMQDIISRVNNSSAKPHPTGTPKTGDNWTSRLQEECNRQGFSNQIVDGLPGPNTLAGCPTLRYGASGNITKLAQEKLISLGYSCGPCGADGEFGNATRVAVIKFQKDNGLTPDAIVGKNTWRVLLGL